MMVLIVPETIVTRYLHSNCVKNLCKFFCANSIVVLSVNDSVGVYQLSVYGREKFFLLSNCMVTLDFYRYQFEFKYSMIWVGF